MAHFQYILDVFSEFRCMAVPSSSQLMATRSQLEQKQ